MKNKIQNYVERLTQLVHRFSDVRFIGQIVFVVIVLLASYSGIKSIQTNYGLQKQIGSLQQQDDVQQLENDNQQLENNYYDSNQYLELSARQNFGLAAPGEKEIIVPENVAQTYAASLPAAKKPTVVTNVVAKQSNPQAWVNFFLHRNVNS